MWSIIAGRIRRSRGFRLLAPLLENNPLPSPLPPCASLPRTIQSRFASISSCPSNYAMKSSAPPSMVFPFSLPRSLAYSSADASADASPFGAVALPPLPSPRPPPSSSTSPTPSPSPAQPPPPDARNGREHVGVLIQCDSVKRKRRKMMKKHQRTSDDSFDSRRTRTYRLGAYIHPQHVPSTNQQPLPSPRGGKVGVGRCLSCPWRRGNPYPLISVGDFSPVSASPSPTHVHTPPTIRAGQKRRKAQRFMLRKLGKI